MSKKDQRSDLEKFIERLYYFLKNTFNLDDFQAGTIAVEILVIPISFIFGFIYLNNSIFQTLFYATLGLLAITIAYSIFMPLYKKNKRVEAIKVIKTRTIEIKNSNDINNLKPLEFEIFAREYFIKQGYEAWTTKRTHDNGADVIVEKNNVRTAIQVKHSTNPINGYAIYQTKRGVQNYQAEKGILMTNSELTNQAKLDAKNFEVEYIDIHEISKFLRKNGSISVKLDNNQLKQIP